MRPHRRRLARREERCRAVGVGAKQIDEQEDQADEDHAAAVLLYAKGVPHDGCEVASGGNRWSNGGQDILIGT
jgi:hypothetical protein